jgi:uncharacterized protein
MDKVTHFEVPAENVERAKEFYEKTFEWAISKVPEMEYWMAHTGEVDENHMIKDKGVINGGMYKRGEGSSKHPVIVIDVQNIKETMEKIKSNGGKILCDIKDVGSMGKYAQFEDSEGNTMGIWETLKK